MNQNTSLVFQEDLTNEVEMEACFGIRQACTFWYFFCEIGRFKKISTRFFNGNELILLVFETK